MFLRKLLKFTSGSAPGRRLSHCALVMPLYFLPILSSLSTNMCKQVTSRQHSMQGDSNGINTRLLFCTHLLSGLDYYLLNSL